MNHRGKYLKNLCMMWAYVRPAHVTNENWKAEPGGHELPLRNTGVHLQYAKASTALVQNLSGEEKRSLVSWLR